MKKLALGLLAIVATAMILLWFLGLSPLALKANLDVGLGMSAKLGCSARFVSHMQPDQIQADLASYSAALNVFDIEYDAAASTATASVLGMGATTAQWRPGLGCTLNIGNTQALDATRIPELPAPAGLWPRGTAVEPPHGELQSVTDDLLAADNAAGQQTRALLVAHRGRIVAESYAPGFDVDTPLLGWSMGKSLMAILLGHLALQEELSTQDKGLFSEWQDARQDLTLEHLLHMSSGLDFAEVYAPGSDATRMLFSSYSAPAVAKASLLAHEPGSHFSYSSGTTNLLAQVFFDRVGGLQPATDRLYRRLLGPLSMRHTIVEPDPSGVWVASSYVYASARDWARLGQLLLNDGELNGTQVLSPAWVAASEQPNQSSNNPGYGYQLWLNQNGDDMRWPTLPTDAYAMMGNREQRVMVIPSAQAVLVRLGWSPGHYPTDDNFARLLAALPE